jgi:hypothetical protein
MHHPKWQNRRIYQDDFDLLHEGVRRMAKHFNWEVIERPVEGDEQAENVITLEELGLHRLRPLPVEPEPESPTVDDEPTAVSEVLPGVDDDSLICETCVNRHNAPGSGPCGTCDLTLDGQASEYRPEPEETLEEPEETLDENETEGQATLEGT